MIPTPSCTIANRIQAYLRDHDSLKATLVVFSLSWDQLLIDWVQAWSWGTDNLARKTAKIWSFTMCNFARALMLDVHTLPRSSMKAWTDYTDPVEGKVPLLKLGQWVLLSKLEGFISSSGSEEDRSRANEAERSPIPSVGSLKPTLEDAEAKTDEEPCDALHSSRLTRSAGSGEEQKVIDLMGYKVDTRGWVLA